MEDEGKKSVITEESIPFARTPAVLVLDGRRTQIQVYVSERSALHVAEVDRHATLTGMSGLLEFGELSVPIRLVKEMTPRGSHYNARFYADTPNLQTGLKDFVNGRKIHPPLWERKYPRFGVRLVADKGSVVPAHLVWKAGARYNYPQVINFTLGGFLLEAHGNELASCAPDMRWNFDVQLNDGSLIKGLEGRLVRINEERILTDNRTFRQIALSLTPASQNNAVFKTLILNSLEALTGRR